MDVDDSVLQRVSAANEETFFSKTFGDAPPYGTVVGKGDVLDVSIWEAPPAVLFGVATASGLEASTGIQSRASNLPEQMVETDGTIFVPFVGHIVAAGRTPAQIGDAIQGSLRGKAHLPQVVVRRITNYTANVTVVGEVAKSTRMALTATGERLLDALASAGGTKEPISKITMQVTRGKDVASMPLEQLIRDPRQNIRLMPNDVITLLYQPYSFTALGAVQKSSEVQFEGTGLTLAEALGRIGGLSDDRSDTKGVFIFRMENQGTIQTSVESSISTQLTPVIYRFNLRDPASLFIAQRFSIKNKDVLYVSNSTTSDIQKFLTLVSSATFSLTGIGNAVQ